jgi:hypothetical protein
MFYFNRDINFNFFKIWYSFKLSNPTSNMLDKPNFKIGFNSINFDIEIKDIIIKILIDNDENNEDEKDNEIPISKNKEIIIKINEDFLEG